MLTAVIRSEAIIHSQWEHGSFFLSLRKVAHFCGDGQGLLMSTPSCVLIAAATPQTILTHSIAPQLADHLFFFLPSAYKYSHSISERDKYPPHRYYPS